MAQPIVCGECGNVVPFGRLSCPECGELLASVAGAGRRASTNGLADTEVAVAELPPSSWPTPVDELSDGLEFDDDDGLPARQIDAPTVTVGSMPAAAAAGPAVAATAGVAPASYTSPGAYVPPVLQPAGPVAPARAWAGHAGEAGADGLNGSGAAAVASAAVVGRRRTHPSRGPRSSMPLRRSSSSAGSRSLALRLRRPGSSCRGR